MASNANQPPSEGFSVEEKVHLLPPQTASHGKPPTFLGESLKRFVVNAALLHLIDPVRGEPTTHSLDRHPHDDAWKHEQLQKKFLDSFALISSTSRVGGDTASAVCMEQGHPGGTVLRLARNLGVNDGLVRNLEEILERLAAIETLSRERTMKDIESEILRRIIALNSDKIWSLLEGLRSPEVYSSVMTAIRRMEEDNLYSQEAEANSFRLWVRKLSLLASIDDQSEAASLVPHVKWASEARWVYSEHLEAFLASEAGELPPWVKNIYKLGRYYAATKAMIKLAVKQPHIFSGIRVEAVEAPQQEKFSLGTEKTPLLTAMKRITKVKPDILLEQLGETWLTENPEARLRRACRLTLTVHAEMQLLSFYDHRPDLTPRLLFMGTSKKACYLCYEFMSRHPLAIGVSASHQKIYPAWMLAPCSSRVRKKHKVMLWEFSRHLEETAARDLETRLGLSRRPNNLDSTAGPSLTTTGTLSTGFADSDLKSVHMQI